jgi:hypothetical protein
MTSRKASTIPAVIGLESHSGWAALVALAGPVEEPSVVVRERIELSDPEDGRAKQPFHAAEAMPFPRAAKFIAAAIADASRRAAGELGRVLEGMAKGGWTAARCGLVLSSARALPALESILASHALIHAAEGDHFRDALAEAAESRGIEVVRVPRKELPGRASRILRISEPKLQAQVTRLGRTVGAPWGRDQKLAALAAWMVLEK